MEKTYIDNFVKIILSLTLTLSSQLQPRSSAPAEGRSEVMGPESSSGMVGLKTGVLSRWFKLPWVPLLGTDLRPRRSNGESSQLSMTHIL